MKTPIKVFIDSDVVISSVISAKGAAYQLLNKNTSIQLYTSNLSQKEINIVAQRLRLDSKKLNDIYNKFEVVDIEEDVEKIRVKFKEYTSDINDSHIVAGAVKSRAKFLITYNLKHYKTDKRKLDFDIIVLAPGNFLQYLRSLSK